jgi:hypothetical protein
MVETDAGLFIRRIPDASPLHPDLPVGEAAEEATGDAAAVWGLPDFVFRTEPRRVGSGVREIGDGIVIAGEIGLVVQVKSRENVSADEERERRWIAKKIEQAFAQANGSIRSLTGATPTELKSRRGRTHTIDGRTIRWIPVVVIDHPSVPGDVTPALPDARPGVVLLRRDWEFVFEQLKSTSAVIAYFDRVAGETVTLGNEFVRYYDLAQADAQTPPGPLNPEVFGGRGIPTSAPVLPMAPLDPVAGRLVRLILEDVAVAGARQLPEEQRLRTLSELDRLPVAYREETGRFLVEALRQVSSAREGIEWRLRQIVGAEETALLGFAACSHFEDDIVIAFRAWLSLRHHQLQQVTGKVSELTSTGVLLTPRHDGQRTWDTTVITAQGDLGFTDDELRGFESVWGQPGTTSISH